MLEVKNVMVKGNRQDTRLSYTTEKSFKKTWEPVYTKGKATKVN